MVLDLSGIVLISLLGLVIAGAAYGFWWLMEASFQRSATRDFLNR